MSGFGSEEYRADKGDAKPCMYRSGVDLQAPGKPGYSIMETFAGYGCDVWTRDHEGHGKSDRTDGGSPTDEGVARRGVGTGRRFEVAGKKG